MEPQLANRETASSSCTFTFFDCLSSKDRDVPPAIGAPANIKREMRVLYQQPHLVEPMRLRVYEDLPATPTTPEISQLTQWGRNLASRASSRASKISTRRRTTSKSFISKPLPLVADSSSDLPFRRRREFTPIQLSIYEPYNRLSPLPEFNRLSFTEVGELKAPPRVLVRTQSEQILQTHNPVVEPPRRITSMVEVGTAVISRPETSYSIMSTSRPPSEYDALNSHPVSWASFPGFPAPKNNKPEGSVTIMTPMQEEFSPIATAVTIDGTALHFPRESGAATTPIVVDTLNESTSEAPAPFPTISRGPSDATPRPRRDSSIRPYFHTNYQTQKRISQWLHHRSNSKSISTISSFSTGASFAEHRRKRSEFYKLGNYAQVPVISSPSSPPQPLSFAFASSSFKTQRTSAHNHNRSNTQSTSHSTVGTSVLSEDFDRDEASVRFSRDSMTTVTAADVATLASRPATMKSVLVPAGGGLRFVNTDDKDIVVSVVAPVSHCGEIVDYNYDDDGVYLGEIGANLRSSSVGVAF